MIRAISYTIMFCGASAGAALALALVHDASMNAPVSERARVAPQVAALPTVEQEAIAVVFASPAPEAVQTPRVAPVLPAAPQAASVTPGIDTETSAPAPQRAATKPVATTALPRYTASQPRQVIGATTQDSNNRGGFSHSPDGRDEFSPSHFGRALPDAEIARSVPLFEPIDGTVADLRYTWSIGVYR